MTLPETKTLTPHWKGALLYYSFPALDALPFVRHGFSTRLGGVSDGIFASMNLSFTRGDSPQRVRENFERSAAAVEHHHPGAVAPLRRILGDQLLRERVVEQ